MWEVILVGLTRIRLDAEGEGNDFNAKTPSPGGLPSDFGMVGAQNIATGSDFPNWVMLAEPYAFS